MTRSGLPVNEALDDLGLLEPGSFKASYRRWLTVQGRDGEETPVGTLRFVAWWSAQEGEPVRKPIVPRVMDTDLVIGWWLTWCRVTGRERLIPFDLRWFVEWWEGP